MRYPNNSKTIRMVGLIILLLTLVIRPETTVKITQAQAENETIYLPSVMYNPYPVLTGPGSWPMVAANPERTSYTSTEVTGNLKAEWFTHFDAYISQKVQIIAADNKLFIAATDGLHALDSNSGSRHWFFPTSLPPGNSPTFADGVLYMGAFDRNLYAIDARTGQEIWRYTAGSGFQTNPLVINNLVLAGNRDGYFYAIHAVGEKAGQLAWRYKTGGPILLSAAFKDGVLYFAAQDNHAYALNASDGRLVWKSAKLPGSGFHSWWPVVYQNYVVFSGRWIYRYPVPFANATHNVLDRDAYPPGAAEGSLIGSTGTIPGDWAAGTKTLNASRISQYLETYPQRRTTIVLSRSNGAEFTYDSDRDGKPEYAPFLFLGAQNGQRYPPVIGPDNVLYQANNYIYNQWIPRGHITGWKFGTTTISIPTPQTNAVDESIGYAVGGNTIYWKRCCDRTFGSFSITSSANRIYFDEGGMRLRRTLPELFEKGWEFAYWKVGDQSPPIPYNGRVYTINNNAVVAFSPYGRDPVLPLDEDRGYATGVQPGEIELAKVFTGLNTKVTLDSANWPLLYQQERYYEFREESSTRANHFPILQIAGAASGSPTSVQENGGGILKTLTSTFSGGSLTTYISNRAPAVLFHNTSSTYQLSGKQSDGKQLLGSLVGIAYASSNGVQIHTGSATIPGSSLSESWLLAWDSTASHRWMPLVISLQNRPTQVRLDSAGLTLTYPAPAGYLSVTPLYGMSAPKSAEETTWKTNIPSPTVDRVRTLNRLARAFPSSATETMTIDSGSGDVDLTYTYQYITFTDAWNTAPLQLAYLPPQTALAAWNGSPITVNGAGYEALFDLDFITPIGRAAGWPESNSVQARLPGLANTWRQPPAVPGMPDAGDPLRAKLEEEVQKMLDAGHLLPGYGSHGIWDAKAKDRLGTALADYWHNPAETVYTLVHALPLLPTGMQTAVRQYLTNEFDKYPTHSFTHVGWASGTSRQAFPFPTEVESARASIGPCGTGCPTYWGFNPENHYASWLYADQFGGAASIYTNTAAKMVVNPTHPQSFSYSLNSNIAGHIGFLHLAELANQGPKPDVEKALVDMLILRAALSKYPSALEAAGFEYGGYKWAMRTYAPNMPDTLFALRTIGTLWSQTPFYGYQMDTIYGLSGPAAGGAYVFGIDYVNLVPELGNFMRLYTLKEEQVAIADYEKRAPYWFVANAEEAAGEGVTRPIYDTIALYQAKAYILQVNRSELERYLDVPAVPVGDLYYIQKLILAMEAGQ